MITVFPLPLAKAELAFEEFIVALKSGEVEHGMLIPPSGQTASSSLVFSVGPFSLVNMLPLCLQHLVYCGLLPPVCEAGGVHLRPAGGFHSSCSLSSRAGVDRDSEMRRSSML